MEWVSRWSPGKAYPLGSTWDGQGINFALVAPNAQSVTLCIFNETGTEEIAQLSMPACENGVWHGYLADASPGLIYGYRVFGPYAPELGHRFNFRKVLLDPYARDIVGDYLGQDEFKGDHLSDTAAIALKARVTDASYDWEGDVRPCVPLAETILYEMHVKGFTKLHPKVLPSLQGTYAGMVQPEILDYLQQLGITSVSLLPVHFRADEARLQKSGLSNYWGYSSIGFFAPETRYWSQRSGSTPISEFRDMVKALHRRGIEVILDVVYNHTGETDEDGPTLSFRGIDNALYYRLKPDNLAAYENWTGCGNCLNVNEPRVLQLVMDSLRYWVQEMHVDGFRFDLAPILARGQMGYSSSSSFLSAVGQDPVLSQVKLIAEPWDMGPDGYQVGNFPAGWLEWNDRFRDTMRSFWLRQSSTVGDFARRFAASSDLFRQHGRLPHASVNFITAHDGFTLRDLVSYNHKHNYANGEKNRDGHQHNYSWNGGIEGPTEDSQIKQLRMCLKRALLATAILSQGTPMLLAGDEIGHTQGGNNNAYCQDNETSWLNWKNADLDLLHYVQKLIALRRTWPALRYDSWYNIEMRDSDRYVIQWINAEAKRMDEISWHDKNNHCLGIQLQDIAHNETLLILINANALPQHFLLPAQKWQILIDSVQQQGGQIEMEIEGFVMLAAHSVLISKLLMDNA
jgi:glycogen debranching enzyme GlgX